MKKILNFIFVYILMFLFCSSVFAEVIAIDDVVSEFSKTYTISSLKQLGSTLSLVLDGENNKLNLIIEDERSISFDYTNEYIEYNNRDTIVTEENSYDDFVVSLFVEGIIETLFNLSNYNDMMLNYDEEISSLTYEEYGIKFETEPYEYSGTSEDGSEWTTSGNYLKYFKISLDSGLISKLADDYGVEINKEKESIFKDAIPVMRIGEDIGSTYVYLYANIEGYDEEKELDTPLCNFYRSTSIDGEYELVTNWQIPCLGEVGIKDEGLQSNTTYYYKAMVVGSTNYSEVVSVTTLDDNNGEIDVENGENTNNNEQNSNETVDKTGENDLKDIENPKTGSKILYLVFGSLISIIILLIIVFKYYDRVNNKV